MLVPDLLYYTSERRLKNFGDYLSVWLASKFVSPPLIEATAYHLIGSVIDAVNIRDDVSRLKMTGDYKIVYWCCGMRDWNPVPSELREHCVFLGVRGYLTRDLLGLPVDTPIGDPALLCPVIYQPRHDPLSAKKSVCIPHYSETKSYMHIRNETGADEVISPIVADFGDVERLIDCITSASFVLCGSLHAAIVACAYNVPFAFFESGAIDAPFKWHDFASSIGYEVRFFSGVSSGLDHYIHQSNRLRRPDLTAIIGCCPYNLPLDIVLKCIIEQGGCKEPAVTHLLNASGDLTRSRISSLGAASARDNTNSKFYSETASAQVHPFSSQSYADYDTYEGPSPCFQFSLGSASLSLLGLGWSTPENWGVWSDGLYSEIAMPFFDSWHSILALDIVCYVRFLGSYFGMNVDLLFDDNYFSTFRFIRRELDNDLPATLRLVLNDELRDFSPRRLTLRFDNEAGFEQSRYRSDKRNIAVGLVELRVIRRSVPDLEPV